MTKLNQEDLIEKIIDLYRNDAEDPKTDMCRDCYKVFKKKETAK